MGNEGMEYPLPEPNRMMINMTSELNDIHKKLLKEKITNEL
jgi:hypothetical protein